MKQLVIVTASYDNASKVYVKKKIQACAEEGIPCQHIEVINRKYNRYNDDLYNLTELLKDLSADDNVGGILLQLPLASHLEKHERELIDLIAPEKDVDCLTTYNQGRIMAGDNSFLPCTTQAVLDDIKAHTPKGDLNGEKVHVVGRSVLVTKPLILALINEGASVTNWNRNFNKTRVRNSIFDDLDRSGAWVDHERIHFVTGVGLPEYWDNLYFDYDLRNRVYLYDIGMNRNMDGELCGDIKRGYTGFAYQSPVPGGIGPKTVANVIGNFKKLNG